MLVCAAGADSGDLLRQGVAFQIPEKFSEGRFTFTHTNIVCVALTPFGIDCRMNTSPCNRDTVTTLLPDSVGQTSRGEKETAHKTDADSVDIAFFYEIGHSSEIRGIVGSVKEDLGSESLVLERRVNVLE